MFGSVVTYFFERLLGITQEADSAGYEKLVISPYMPPQSSRLSGSRELPCGCVAASYERDSENSGLVRAKVTLPEGKTAVFKHRDFEMTLISGENRFEFEA
jgi:hypothetical protein